MSPYGFIPHQFESGSCRFLIYFIFIFLSKSDDFLSTAKIKIKFKIKKRVDVEDELVKLNL